MSNLDQDVVLGNIRAHSVALSSQDLSDNDLKYLALCDKILRQVVADGVPLFPIVEFMRDKFDAQKDNDGQTCIYLDDAPECDSNHDDYMEGCSCPEN